MCVGVGKYVGLCNFLRQLGEEALGVAREHGRFPNVGQAQEEHDHALQPHAAAAMGQGAMPKAVHVGLNCGHLGALCLSLRKKGV